MRFASALVLVVLAAMAAPPALDEQGSFDLWDGIRIVLSAFFLAVGLRLAIPQFTTVNLLAAAALLIFGVFATYFLAVDGCVDGGGIIEGWRCVGARHPMRSADGPHWLGIVFWLGCLAFAVRTLLDRSRIALRRALAIAALVGTIAPMIFIGYLINNISVTADTEMTTGG